MHIHTYTCTTRTLSLPLSLSASLPLSLSLSLSLSPSLVLLHFRHPPPSKAGLFFFFFLFVFQAAWVVRCLLGFASLFFFAGAIRTVFSQLISSHQQIPQQVRLPVLDFRVGSRPHPIPSHPIPSNPIPSLPFLDRSTLPTAVARSITRAAMLWAVLMFFESTPSSIH
ncbi:hypothetical protein DFJ73DRAFT_518923 [Zopfochytrium polystomum]|nr:hypothetical protein DFJ73DRAFT_518923 [Zopfochytrium polystomum]